ncbi:hypothetical protein [Streptomyces bauhiniae]|uniref:Uncharacterized protein n=1 Tax=Streptomyces bauhiniae TaxID=2340725 RepID=A0A7K3QRC1_9ACTN|nr:hypothetical protein [Streptomyces bauhiniae]NEB92444.1 hypothetical protein [Streptomyces bauhiniae]
MALPSFATAADLAAVMQAPVDADAAAVALASASAVIRKWARQDISLVVDDVVRLRVIDCEALVLPQRPVVSVSDVRVGSLVLSDWVLSGDRLLRAGGWHRLPGTTSYPGAGLVQVTYTHGEEDPAVARAVCLDLASSTMANPSMLRQEAIDDYSRTFASESLGVGSLSETHKELLADYRRRVGTLGLR